MNNFLNYFKNLEIKVIGIGVTSFNRALPAFFLPDYQIICYKNSQELLEISHKCKVVAIERDFRQGIESLSGYAILNHPGVQNYLRGLGGKIGILVYKSSRGIAEICKKNGWQLIANRPEIRDPFENKKIFRETLERLGLPLIEGEILKLSEFNEQVFNKMQKKYGPNLVLKLPEVTQGGGRGNIFASEAQDLTRLWLKIKGLQKLYQLEHLIVERRVEGISPSITGCVTRFGVLTGVVQTQITDIPEVVDVTKGGGMFVGHDWSYRHYSPEIQNQAEKITKPFGDHLYQQGYRGVFGIDLLVEKGTDKVYPVECNPRYTGAFPVYSMIQLKQGEPPFDVFHLLEHLGIDYQMDFESVQRQYRQPKQGAHLILSNKTDDFLEIKGGVRAGVLRFTGRQLEFVRPGFSLLEIENEEEFVLTDGVPEKGVVIRPGMRILKVIFPGGILTEQGKEISEKTRKIVAAIYRHLQLQKIASPKASLVEDTEY